MKAFKLFGLGSWIVAGMLLFSYPYVFNVLLGLPEDRIIWILFFAMSLLVLSTSKQSGLGLPAILKYSMLIQGVVWFAYSIIHDDTSYFTRLFLILFSYVIILMLIRRKEVAKFAALNTYIFALQGVLGAVAFVLIYVGVLQAISIVQVSDDRFLSWFILTCSNSVYGNFIRVGGYLDEPGALATWGIFALVINKFSINNKKIEILLLISLLFTFSAAYFIILPIYAIAFYSSKIKHIIPITIGGLVIVYLAFHFLGANSDFQTLTVDRFGDSGVESKREIYAEQAKRYYEQHKVFGVGGKNMALLESSNDNPYEILAKDGIVGYIATYLPLLFALLRYRKKEAWAAIGILLLCYQQRPFHINMMHSFMLYFIILSLEYRYYDRYKHEDIEFESFFPKFLQK